MMCGWRPRKGSWEAVCFSFLEKERERKRGAKRGKGDGAAVIGSENPCYLLHNRKQILKRMFSLWNV